MGLGAEGYSAAAATSMDVIAVATAHLGFLWLASALSAVVLISPTQMLPLIAFAHAVLFMNINCFGHQV